MKQISSPRYSYQGMGFVVIAVKTPEPCSLADPSIGMISRPSSIQNTRIGSLLRDWSRKLSGEGVAMDKQKSLGLQATKMDALAAVPLDIIVFHIEITKVEQKSEVGRDVNENPGFVPSHLQGLSCYSWVPNVRQDIKLTKNRLKSSLKPFASAKGTPSIRYRSSNNRISLDG